MNEDKFKKIDDLNTTLDNLNNTLPAIFSYIGEFDGVAENIVQAEIDKLCIRTSNEINAKLDSKRSDLIKFLHEGYVSSNEVIELLKPLIEMNIADLSGVIKAVKTIISIYTKPYETAIEYITVLGPKLLTLADNIASLASLKDQIPLPPDLTNMNLNYNQLNITMQPITIQEVITGKSSNESVS